MNPFEALRKADPAERLTGAELEDRDDRLLRSIVESADSAPGGGAGWIRATSPARDRRPLLATVLVALAVVVVAVIAIRTVPSSRTDPPVAAESSTSATTVLEDAVFATLSEVVTGTVPVREKSALTWTDQHPTVRGGGIDANGRTLFIAAACDGGGSIAIQVTGRPDAVLDCDGLSTIGPIGLTSGAKDQQGVSLDVVVASGHPRYVAKSMAFAEDGDGSPPGG